MVIKDNDMIAIFVFKAFLKFSLGWFGLVALVQNLNKEVFEFLMTFLPSQVVMAFGFLYLMAILFKKISMSLSDSWAYHQINELKVKKEIETHKQSKLDTDIKSEELKDKKNG